MLPTMLYTTAAGGDGRKLYGQEAWRVMMAGISEVVTFESLDDFQCFMYLGTQGDRDEVEAKKNELVAALARHAVSKAKAAAPAAAAKAAVVPKAVGKAKSAAAAPKAAAAPAAGP